MRHDADVLLTSKGNLIACLIRRARVRGLHKLWPLLIRRGRVDFLLQTKEESFIADELESMMSPVTEQKEADKAAKQLERAEKVAHMKEVKHQVKENAQKQAENMDAYVMLSFDTYEAKAAFCERFGYEPDMKFIKGEVFDEQVERID